LLGSAALTIGYRSIALSCTLASQQRIRLDFDSPNRLACTPLALAKLDQTRRCKKLRVALRALSGYPSLDLAARCRNQRKRLISAVNRIDRVRRKLRRQCLLGSAARIKRLRRSERTDRKPHQQRSRRRKNFSQCQTISRFV
jgi:hypothetical protein